LPKIAGGSSVPGSPIPHVGASCVYCRSRPRLDEVAGPCISAVVGLEEELRGADRTLLARRSARASRPATLAKTGATTEAGAAAGGKTRARGASARPGRQGSPSALRGLDSGLAAAGEPVRQPLAAPARRARAAGLALVRRMEEVAGPLEHAMTEDRLATKRSTALGAHQETSHAASCNRSGRKGIPDLPSGREGEDPRGTQVPDQAARRVPGQAAAEPGDPGDVGRGVRCGRPCARCGTRCEGRASHLGAKPGRRSTPDQDRPARRAGAEPGVVPRGPAVGAHPERASTSLENLVQLTRRAGLVEDEAQQHGQEPAPQPAGLDAQKAEHSDAQPDSSAVDRARRKRAGARRADADGDRVARRTDRRRRQGDPPARQGERDLSSADDGSGNRAGDGDAVRRDAGRRDALRDSARRPSVPRTDARRELELEPQAADAPDQSRLASDAVVAGSGSMDRASLRLEASDVDLGDAGRRAPRQADRRRGTREEARRDRIRDVAGRQDVRPSAGCQLAAGIAQEPLAIATSTSCPETAIACAHGSQTLRLNSVPTIATPSTDAHNCAITSANSRSRQLVTHTGQAEPDEAEKDPRWEDLRLTQVPLHSRGREFDFGHWLFRNIQSHDPSPAVFGYPF